MFSVEIGVGAPTLSLRCVDDPAPQAIVRIGAAAAFLTEVGMMSLDAGPDDSDSTPVGLLCMSELVPLVRVMALGLNVIIINTSSAKPS